MTHRAAKAVAIAAAPAQAEPPYLSMSSSIRMAVSDSTRSPGGNTISKVDSNRITGDF